MGDRQWPDPRGWEALTQAEAERDARAAALKRGLRELRARTRHQFFEVTLTREEAQAVLDALAVAEREREELATSVERLRDSNRSLQRSAISNRDGRKRAEGERDQAREALREADRILEWWHGTFEPHTRRAWNYNDCEPCRTIREQVRGALGEDPQNVTLRRFGLRLWFRVRGRWHGVP